MCVLNLCALRIEMMKAIRIIYEEQCEHCSARKELKDRDNRAVINIRIRGEMRDETKEL